MFRMSFFIPSFAANHTAMNALHYILFAAALLSTAACISEELWLSTGKSRGDCHSRTPSDGIEDLPSEKDTLILMSGVKFEDGYDWRRDTDYGQAGFEVVLYRNFKPYLRIPFSSGLVSPDPDTHHIIDAQLYTEHVHMGKTRLARDGKLLLAFDGMEFFKGILPDGDDIYTLSERRDGAGFTLRLNGEILFSRDHGTVFGDLADPSYRPYGALYKDGGKLCFCYRDGGGGDERYYFVMDGEAEDSGCKEMYDIQDLKVIGGHPVSAEASCLWFMVQEGRIWRGDGDKLTLSGWMSYGGADNTSCTVTGDDPETLREICPGDALILHGEKTGYAVLDTPGGVEIWGSDDDRSPRGALPGYHLLSDSCADISGDGHLYAVLTPDKGDTHTTFCNGEHRTVELHGYFSAIRAHTRISPPK